MRRESRLLQVYQMKERLLGPQVAGEPADITEERARVRLRIREMLAEIAELTRTDRDDRDWADAG